MKILEMTPESIAFAKHYDIFCRVANTMKTYTLAFNKKKLNWDDNIPDMLNDFFSAEAAAFKAAKGLTDEQLVDYINDKLITACKNEDDLLIIFEI